LRLKEVALLDVFEAELDKECGSNCHPEDVYITGKSWRFVRSYDEISDSQLLAACIDDEPVVLVGYSDRIEIGDLKQSLPGVLSGSIFLETCFGGFVRKKESARIALSSVSVALAASVTTSQ
jgi:hypothetical protein